MIEALFTPISLGDIRLANRVIMAPMTRGRAGEGDVPTAAMVEYYAQRASAGLIVTEGVQPCAEGKGYWRTPGIYTAEQIAGWAKVTAAVHARGGRIVLQLMHCGRVVVPANRGFAADIVAPSAIACPVPVPGPDGVPVPTAMPRALAADELPGVAAQFAGAARNAISAGFDGVELHCASGYLINQFLNPASNLRTDAYGGSPENRIRFALMVIAAMADAIGAGRVGLRISPGNPYNGMDPDQPRTTFEPLLAALSGNGLAYCHVVDMALADCDTLTMVGNSFGGPIIANNGLNMASAAAIVHNGQAQAVSFGRAFIANPDLPHRMRHGLALAKPDYALLYTGEERGYIDYPAA
jgi:N-ethylmaleimide reductase